MNLYIKKLLKENLITFNELEKLTDKVLKYSFFYVMRESYKHKNPKKALQQIPFVFQNIKNDFIKLKPFLENFYISVSLSTTLKNNVYGSLLTISEDEALLKLKVDLKKLVDFLDERLKPYYGQNISSDEVNRISNELYDTFIDRNLFKVTLHELQHAYDSWRSKGKYLRNKKAFDYEKKYGSKDDDKEKNKQNKIISQQQYIDYLKLPYEVNARFTEAISSINIKNDNGKIKNFIDYKKDFITNFEGYNKMTPNTLKRINIRLYKLYQEKIASN